MRAPRDFRLERLAQVLTPQQIRGRAVLTLRCDDCQGVPVAYVTYVDGLPVIWLRQQRRRERLWVARRLGAPPFDAYAAWCHEREFVVRLAPEWLPSRGSKERRELRASHTSEWGAVP